MASWTKAAMKALEAEGGFQADPADTANYVDGKLIGTNRGISAIAYKQFYGKTPTVQDMKDLNGTQAKAIYKKNYWDKINGDRINNQSVADLMFQFVIGSGLSQIKTLKLLANATSGTKQFAETTTPITNAEAEIINGLDQAAYFKRLWNYRKDFFQKVVDKSIADWTEKHGRKPTEAEALKDTKKRFLKGWLKRLDTHKYEGPTGSTGGAFNLTKKQMIIGGAVLAVAGLLYAADQGYIKVPKSLLV